MPLPYRSRSRLACVLLAAFAAAPALGHADEGFWPFNRLPRAAIKQALGVDLSDAWVQRVQQASIRFPGGSGSFVSPDGLVLTNHHVSLEMLNKLSTPERDLASQGYMAHDRSQELKAPDLELLSLQSIEDVTVKVNASVAREMAPAETLAARRAAIAAIEQEAQTRTGIEAEVVTLFQGAQYHLYLYRKFTDVRLVFAPEFAAAFYGGDPDNFTFPRYCLDMTLWRVYDNDRPLVTAHYLPWSVAGVKEGDPVFTSGHPGQTQRLNTVAHLEYLRDVALPLSIDAYTEIRNALEAYGRQGAEQLRQAGDDFFGIENALKSWKGQIAGLRDPSLMNKKREAERALRARVDADADFRAKYAGAWDAIAKARTDLLGYNLERVFLEGGLGLNSEYFQRARALVRWAAESAKPNGERLPEYGEARKAQLERQIFSEAPMYPALEQAKLTASLTLMARYLGGTHPAVAQILAGKSRPLVPKSSYAARGWAIRPFAGRS